MQKDDEGTCNAELELNIDINTFTEDIYCYKRLEEFLWKNIRLKSNL